MRRLICRIAYYDYFVVQSEQVLPGGQTGAIERIVARSGPLIKKRTMGIRLDPEQVDEQGLPVVAWEEDRNLFAPEGAGRARITCFIRPDAFGVLQFVSAGSVREGAFEEARPWEALHSFQSGPAEQLYTTQAERAWRDVLTARSKSGMVRAILTDSAQVMMANFADEHASVAMHLNCAEASTVDMARLHDRLHNAFIVKRTLLMKQKCGPDRKWPKATPFVAHKPPAPPYEPPWVAPLVYALFAAALGAAGFAFYWFVVR